MRVFCLSLAAMIASPALAADWMVDDSASTIQIETSAFGRAVTGNFSEFSAHISLDPENLADARIEGQVSVASGDTGNPQYNSEMRGRNGLDDDNHPMARFVSTTIATGEDCDDGSGVCLRAVGTLTLAGNEQPADMNFRLNIEGSRAIADGTITIVRDDFGIGSNNWGDAAETVRVRLHIEATR